MTRPIPTNMEQYRIEQNGKYTTVWDETNGVGLRFAHGETLQRYTSELVIKDANRVTTGEGLDVDALSAISAALTDYAAQRFPYEFEPIKP